MVPQVQPRWIYQTTSIDGYLSPGLFVNTVSEPETVFNVLHCSYHKI